ncbi:MAG: LacI family DNA-binding transcriptional regulator [Gammaproteobacteria bacterium]
MTATTPKYARVETYIRRAIRTKQFVRKLPGERTIAKELGYSYMTVRKAIDNLVGEGLLYRIPTKGTFVADGNGVRKKTRTIGYFLDSGIEAGISSPYYSLIFNAIEKEAANYGYSVVYFSDIGANKLREILQKLDGVIATCFPRIEHVIQEMSESVPLVVIDNSSADKAIPSVIIDNFNAEVESVDYLCTLGHARIGFMTGLEDSDVGKNRFAGYQRGLARNKIGFDEALVYRGDYSFDAGIQGAEYFLSLDASPTAVICANDSMALGATRRIQQDKLKVPADISVIGFDDIDIASQISPALTTVAAPVEQIARQSFDILTRLIEGDDVDNRHIALPAELVIRKTCAKLTKKSAAA